MSDTDHTSGGAESDASSLGGVLIHLLALITALFGIGVFVAAAGYRFGSHPFTKANARNALNWHLSVFLLVVTGVVVFAVGTDMTNGGSLIEWATLPPPVASAVAALGTALTVGGFLLLFLSAVAALLTIVFTIAATLNAVAGNAWSYPFAPNLVARLE